MPSPEVVCLVQLSADLSYLLGTVTTKLATIKCQVDSRKSVYSMELYGPDAKGLKLKERCFELNLETWAKTFKVTAWRLVEYAEYVPP